jgi:hypothetical protein
MSGEPSNWRVSQPDESSFSGADLDGAWDDWDEFALGIPDQDVWDAFELDDGMEEPEPEYGDFWPEDDEDEVEG